MDKNMELDKFITTSLLNIKKGVSHANLLLAKEEGKTIGRDFDPKYAIGNFNGDKNGGYIEFDLAVTANKQNSKSGGGFVNVVSLGFGGKLSESVNNQNITRLRFRVFLYNTIA